ncbi:MAG: hypothetical protein RL660_3088 [Bacteroidota bacterium]
MQAQSNIKLASVQQVGLSYNGTSTLIDGSVSAGVRVKQMHYMLGASFMGSPVLNCAYYADVRRNFTQKSKAYLGTQLGATHMLRAVQLTQINSALWTGDGGNISRKPGIHASGMIGYAAQFGKETFYNVSLYYGVHQLRYTQTYDLPGKPDQVGAISVMQIRYGVRMGLSF